jgi:signal transduction histidine kinase
VLLLLCAGSGEAAPRHVLVLQSLERGNLTLDSFTGNVRVDIDQRSPERVTFTEMVVNPSGFDASPEAAILDYLQAAFAGRHQPDLVMTVGGPAAAFARQHRPRLFPETPLLLAAVERRFVEGAPLGGNETAVAVANDFPGVVEDILQVFPETRNVYVVMDPGPLGSFWRPRLEGEFASFRGRVAFDWWDSLSLGDIVQRAASLPPRSAIFFINFKTDARGGPYPEERVLAELRATASAPLFALQSTQLGHGIVGGRLMAIDELGRRTADVALRILDGESPAGHRPPPQTRGAPVYDARELKRWGVDEDRLPPGSTVLYRDPGVWERFKWAIVLGSAVLIAQAALIGGLLVSRAKRQRAEDSLRRSVADLEAARGTLSKLSRRLMEAQEQERSRIARELHDDVSQRVSFLAMDAARLRETVPGASPGLRGEMGELYDSLITLSRDIQSISHRLHTSKVEYLGLPAAARSLCDDVAARHLVQIQYSH